MSWRNDYPTLECPGCHRKTFYVTPGQRKGTSGRMVVPPAPGMVQAIRRDGLCTTCKRAENGHGPKTLDHGNKHIRRPAISDEELERLRDRIKCMEIDRLNRGVDPEGVPTEDWAYGNGGLYSWEV